MTRQWSYQGALYRFPSSLSSQSRYYLSSAVPGSKSKDLTDPSNCSLTRILLNPVSTPPSILARPSQAMQHAVVFKFRPHAAPKWAIEEPINFSSFATFHALASIEVSNGIFELQVKSQVANIHLQVGCGLWKTRPESVLPDADSTTWNVAQQGAHLFQSTARKLIQLLALAHAGSWDISEFGDCLEFATNRLVIDCRPVTVRKQLQLTPEGATLNFTSKDSPNSQEHKHNIRINVYTRE